MLPAGVTPRSKMSDGGPHLWTSLSRLHELKFEDKELSMNGRSNRPVAKRRTKDQGKSRSAKPEGQATEWELTDDRLDGALRQTFPASDALSMIRNVRGS
jgi:hypothetical protein